MRARILFAILAIVLAPQASAAEAPDFNRQVRPILSAHCFKCHGPDDKTREAGLRLDVREAALLEADSGLTPIVPGKPEESELVRRIFSTDHLERMPPDSANKPLSDAQKQILKDWIAAGANYAPHWAFVPPKQIAPPIVASSPDRAPRQAIDSFIQARLSAAGLTPAREADRYTLVRRVYLDLLGLLPTPEEADAFVSDPAPDAYERLVDRLLASPQYGERWARRWLDLARYADTNGYEKDRVRSMWPYRDWVIQALNADMPFDQFTIEQLAGDMLPGATLQQRVATGFHRNTMINEEGGIDPLEFRYHAMVDRTNTTATVWLGLTLGCAQCHTHKFDPIPHEDYYRQLALLNNADEPTIEVPKPEIAARRAEIEQQIARLEAELPSRFPPKSDREWHVLGPASFASAAGATGEVKEDGSVLVGGSNPERDTYTLSLEVPAGEFTSLRLEALVDPALPSEGPGRTPHGNFVVSEVVFELAAGSGEASAVKLVRGEADFSQQNFPAAHAVDGDPKTGWAIHGPGKWNVNRTLTLSFDKPVKLDAPAQATVKIDQQHGGQHTLGRLRLALGQVVAKDDRPLEERSREHLEEKFAAWIATEAERTSKWHLLEPISATSGVPTLTILDDRSIFVTGDMTKRDVYEVTLDAAGLERITALRLEAMPDDRLPSRGPGRIYYEGPFGDFFLSEVTLRGAGKEPLKFASATHSFASGKSGAPAAIDGDPQTGWSINGAQGRTHYAVFVLDKPLEATDLLQLDLLFERYYAAGLGRFRVWATADPQGCTARDLPHEIDELLLIPAGQHSAEQRQRLLKEFVRVAPELAGERDKIKKLRDSLPAQPTTLVMQERPQGHTRATFVHHRGEFLQPKDPVEPGILSIFPNLADGSVTNRLDFARWLASEANPLVGRVTMNRHWAALFGSGIVRTVEDFGYQGDAPTHPDLLDWLALEFTTNRGWSVKAMHRLIVTSSTYRQSSSLVQSTDPKAPRPTALDPENRLLWHFPRTRLAAEQVRDAALSASGLVTHKLGGPSVFPPQPPGITTEGAYGRLEWKVSTGEDRYRRGLYTFAKRTAPYAMFATFDGPSGEACVARRDVTNTPLQALTMLNDAVLVEAAQALGRDASGAAASGGAPAANTEETVARLFRRCLTRPPTDDEVQMLAAFYRVQKQRLAAGELDASAIAGSGEGDAIDRAAWTLVARAVLNLDEFIVRE